MTHVDLEQHTALLCCLALGYPNIAFGNIILNIFSLLGARVEKALLAVSDTSLDFIP